MSRGSNLSSGKSGDEDTEESITSEDDEDDWEPAHEAMGDGGAVTEESP